MSKMTKEQMRQRARFRIRSKITGTAERPRIAVFRSGRHIYAQAIDDAGGRTLGQASTQDKELKGKLGTGSNIDAAKAVGQLLGERLKQNGVERIVFDRGGFIYHGRIKALAEAAREAGLQF